MRLRSGAAQCALLVAPYELYLKHARQRHRLPTRRLPNPAEIVSLHVAMKRRMRPIADAGDQAVLDRIDVAILDVAAKVLIVADQMFPESTLPDATLAARDP